MSFFLKQTFKYSFFPTEFVCVFALLPDRKKSTYKYLFHELHDRAAQLNTTFNPCTIVSDLERTLAEVLKAEARVI